MDMELLWFRRSDLETGQTCGACTYDYRQAYLYLMSISCRAYEKNVSRSLMGIQIPAVPFSTTWPRYDL